MSKSSEPTIQVRESAESQDEAVDNAEAQQLRRGQRTKTPTEKGREMQEEQMKTLLQNYNYEKWRTQVKTAKRPLSQTTESLSEDLLNDIIHDVTSLSEDVRHV